MNGASVTIISRIIFFSRQHQRAAGRALRGIWPHLLPGATSRGPPGRCCGHPGTP
jgi:hypothetical protein